MGNGVCFIGLCPNVLLMEEGYSSKGYVSWIPLPLLPGNVAGIPPTENVPVRGWHRLVTQGSVLCRSMPPALVL